MPMKTASMLGAAGQGLFAALAAGTCAAAGHSATSDMQVLQRWKLGGPGGWDYSHSPMRQASIFSGAVRRTSTS